MEVHDYNIDLKNNHIFLFGESDYIIGATSEHTSEPGVEYSMANKFIKNMYLCLSKNPNKPITIHLKTAGGDWSEGMAIYDTIKSCPVHVTIINYTHARSMSSLIFSAGDERIMMPNSYFMFHLGTYGIDAEYQTVLSNMKFDEQNADVMISIYAELMNKKGRFANKGIDFIKKWIRKQMAYKGDVFFTAQEAVDYGLADKIKE